MSVSPQSLARTRDKRSHKVPARFNDNVYALVEASESIRTSTRTRPGSMASKREHEEDGSEEKEEAIKIIKSQNSSAKKSKTGNQNEPVPTTSRTPHEQNVDRDSPSSPPPSKTPSPTIPPLAPTISTTSATATVATSAFVTTTATPTTTTITNTQPKTPAYQKHASSAGSNSSSISNNINNPPKKEISPPPQITNKKKSNKGQSLIAKQQAASTAATSSTKHVTKDKLTTQRQGPTATISGGLSNFNIHQSNQPIQPPTNGVAPIVVSNGTAQPAPAIPATVSIMPSVTIAASGLTPTTPRYFNNLATNQQFGTRLMINEPVYLPRSVAPIAPITATLHQIAIQAQRPPFISKKAEACLAYQNDLRLNYMLSNHAALIKIARYLGVKDRFNLRCVNKTWKSVVDSEAVWSRVVFEGNDFNIDDESEMLNYLNKHKTAEVVIKDIECRTLKRANSRPLTKFYSDLLNYLSRINQVFIRSVNYSQNNAAYGLIKSMQENSIPLCRERQASRCKWQVRIAVDPTGIATVDMKASLLRQPEREVTIRGKHCVELFDLVENLNERSCGPGTFEVDIEPI